MFVVSSGMNKFNSKEPLMKLIKKDSSVKMPVEVDMTSMLLFTQEQEPTFAEKRLALSNLSKVNPVVPD